MNRRGPFIAIAVGAVALVTVGLGASRGEVPHKGEESCFSDLASTLEMCKQGAHFGDCMTITDEFADACEAGCVTTYCPDYAPLPPHDTDPIWRASCEDLKGARFWRETHAAETRCDLAFKMPRSREETLALREAWDACFKADVEQHCPALVGTDWHARMSIALGQ
ncbi:hypothetical protein [Polyangium sp. y55x31]|uniref:hypothetical protein n=1 Tax=Polyangium sp. y55x31 TaxID=3042688 RepID=UPI002482A279|nr:hypothetical protein [Polyangium sp. y55x31]MDI1477231.1 hypothetical protein [Polyangium sp. y55x31]